ncbi:MAG: phosphoribosyltransferase family protein [bacterium]|nr:phosphoribosyltransferase family protein [bacterium]
MDDTYFLDRNDAGRKLAAKLKTYYSKPAVIYGLPRGGVVVASEVAQLFHCPLDIVITRKIGHPLNPEYAVGAITEDGFLVGDKATLASLDQTWLVEEIEKQREEAKRRRVVYLNGHESVDVKNKIAIIIDDGIATGLTMLAAIHEIKKRNPKKVVVAVPVAPPDVATQINNKVDDLVVATNPEFFLGAIGGYYENFPQVTDDEVVELLSKNAQELS